MFDERVTDQRYWEVIASSVDVGFSFADGPWLFYYKLFVDKINQ